MLNKIMKSFTDLFYMTKRKREKFEHKNPNEKVLAADASKSIVTEKNKEIQYGFEWVVSKRAVILLTDKRIICGKREIPLNIITTAQLIRVNKIGQVLKIQTDDDKNYQFGMQYNPEWTEQQTLPLIIKNEKIKYSSFSIIIRLIAIGYLIYIIYTRFIINL